MNNSKVILHVKITENITAILEAGTYAGTYFKKKIINTVLYIYKS